MKIAMLILILLTYTVGSYLIIFKNVKYTYYIYYAGNNTNGDMVESWVIRETMNNMDSPSGLQKEIEALDIFKGYPIIVKNWKLLGTQWIYNSKKDIE